MPRAKQTNLGGVGSDHTDLLRRHASFDQVAPRVEESRLASFALNLLSPSRFDLFIELGTGRIDELDRILRQGRRHDARQIAKTMLGHRPIGDQF